MAVESFGIPGLKIGSSQVLREITATRSRIEAPSHILGVTKFDVRSLGAFSFCRGGHFTNVESIGRFCSLAPNLVIGPEEHKTSMLTTSTFINSNAWESRELDAYWSRNKPEQRAALEQIRNPKTRNRLTVTIGNDVWIGQGAVVRRGVTIGDGAVVGANSVVSRDVLPYEIVMGVPAQAIRFRFDADTVEKLISAKWWEWSLDSLDGIRWHDPVAAASELFKRKEGGLYKLATYPTLPV